MIESERIWTHSMTGKNITVFSDDYLVNIFHAPKFRDPLSGGHRMLIRHQSFMRLIITN